MERFAFRLLLLLGLGCLVPGVARAAPCPSNFGIDPETHQCRTVPPPSASLQIKATPGNAVVVRVDKPSVALGANGSAPWRDAWAACPHDKGDALGKNQKLLGPADGTLLRGLARGANYLCIVADDYVPELRRIDVQSADVMRPRDVSLKALPAVSFTQNDRCQYPKPKEFAFKTADGQVLDTWSRSTKSSGSDAASEPAVQFVTLLPAVSLNLRVSADGYEDAPVEGAPLDPGETRPVRLCLVPEHKVSLEFDPLVTNLDIALDGPSHYEMRSNSAEVKDVRLLPGTYVVRAYVPTKAGESLIPISVTGHGQPETGSSFYLPEGAPISTTIYVGLPIPAPAADHPSLSVLENACEAVGNDAESYRRVMAGGYCANAAFLAHAAEEKAKKTAQDASSGKIEIHPFKQGPRSWRDYARHGCELGDPRSCAAVEPAYLEKSKLGLTDLCIQAADSHGWLACVRSRHPQTPIFSYVELGDPTDDTTHDWIDERMVVTGGALYGLGHVHPWSFDFVVGGVFPFSSHSLLGGTFHLGYLVDVLPVQRQVDGAVSSHFVGGGIVAGVGLYWWPLRFERLELGVELARYLNGNAAPMGLYASSALVVKPMNVTIIGALRRMSDIVRGSDGELRTTMAGALVPLVGVRIGVEFSP